MKEDLRGPGIWARSQETLLFLVKRQLPLVAWLDFYKNTSHPAPVTIFRSSHHLMPLRGSVRQSSLHRNTEVNSENLEEAAGKSCKGHCQEK